MLSIRKSSLKVSLISLVLIFSLTEVSQAHLTPAYAHAGGRQTCQPCWMKYLKDDVLLGELSIPGTHETMSFYGGDAVECQSMALRFQLESGIRVLDIRCAIIRSGQNGENSFFNIYHADIYQRETFDGVLDTVVAFLKGHPSETVLMRVKEEKTNDPKWFEAIFRRRYWNRFKDGLDLPEQDRIGRMWNPALYENHTNPTLGEMRGKIAILQDFARWDCCGAGDDNICPGDCITPDEAKYGICYCSFNIQDKYRLRTNFDLYNKWISVKNHLAAANSGPQKTKYMNYLSGSRGSFPYFVVSGHSSPASGARRLSTGRTTPADRNSWPDFPRVNCALGICTIAFEGTNILTYGAILNGYYKNRVGIIMTDFPGWGLINQTIDLNARFRKPNWRLECGEENPRICSPPPQYPTITPVYQFYTDGPWRYNYSLNPDEGTNQGWKRDGIVFFAFGQNQPGLENVYGFYAILRNRRWKFRFSVNPDPPPGWTRGGIAFYAHRNQTPNTMPVYEYETSDFRYRYSTDDTLKVPGWHFRGMSFFTVAAKPPSLP
jgi:1-phosphatidylinositol phosphodiesterase